jgi:hypothetical protein
MKKMKIDARRRVASVAVDRRTKGDATLHAVQVAFRLLLDVVVGALMFAALLMVEGAVVLVVRMVTGRVADSSFTSIMELADEGVRVVDVILYFWFVVTSAVKAAKEFAR